jgi:hypothetical protein
MSHNGSETASDSEPGAPAGRGSWRNVAITVLLLAVVVVVGVAAYDARSQFWNMYLAFKSSK